MGRGSKSNASLSKSLFGEGKPLPASGHKPQEKSAVRGVLLRDSSGHLVAGPQPQTHLPGATESPRKCLLVKRGPFRPSGRGVLPPWPRGLSHYLE